MMTKTALMTSFLLSASALGVAAPAQASGNDVRRSGSCSGSSHWKLKAKPDDGRLEVEAEVDSNVDGQAWRWRLRHDGNGVDHGRSRTTAPSGSFDVQRRVDDHAGSDHLRFRAVNPATGEVCAGSLSL